MAEVEIHNGQILVDGVVQPEAPVLPLAEPKPGPPVVEDTDPEMIAARMAQTISLGMDNKLTPMEIVNSLLTAKSAGGHKLVWTRFDVFQTFALWAKKLDGRAKL